MILERIVVHGFGRLRDLDWSFVPRLNVVYGPNESGKSTLLRAIHALLYGFADGSKRRPVRLGQERDRFRPWHGGPYGGLLYLRLGDGRQFRIQRHFHDEQARVFRDPGATDVTADYEPGSHGWVTFADRHLQLAPAVFAASAYVTQGGLDVDQDARALKEGLERFADSAGVDSTAQEAIAKLDAQIRDRVNPRGFSPETSPLRKATARVAALEDELNASRAALATVEELAREVQAASRHLTTLEQRSVTLAIGIARRELDEIEDRLGRLAALDEAIVATNRELEVLADVANLDEEAFTRAVTAVRDVSRIDSELHDARAQVEADHPTIAAMRQRLDEIRSRLDELPEVDTTLLERAENAVNSWSVASELVGARRIDLDDCQRQIDAHDPAEPLPEAIVALDPEALLRAIEHVRSASANLEASTSDAAPSAGTEAAQAELSDLEASLAGLTAQDLATLREIERAIEAQRRSTPKAAPSLQPIAAVLGAVLGAILGFFAADLVGAVGGAVALGIVGYLIGGALASDQDLPAATGAMGDQADLAKRLAQYRTASVDELQARWNRRAELRQQLQETVAHARQLDAARQAYDQALAKLTELVGRPDLAHAKELYDRLRAWQAREQRRAPLIEARDRARTQLVQAEAAAADRRADAAVALQAVGLRLEGDDPSVLVQALARLRTAHQERARLIPTTIEHEHRITAYDARTREVAALEARLAEARANARECLRTLGCVDDADDGLAAIEERRARFDRYQSAKRTSERLAAARTSLIGGQDPLQWVARRDELRTRIGDATDELPGSIDELQSEQAEVARQREEFIRQIAELRTQLRNVQEQHREPAVIEEELAGARRDRERIERLQTALQSARNVLVEVADDYRRSFAPRLQQSVGDRLARLTGNRYREIAIDPTTLAVQVDSAELPGLVALDRLSHGTRDAVQLLLRLSVAELLTTSGEKVPLFLDDPLVNFDPDRARRTIELLAALADDHQIFYFTQDPRVRDWAAESGATVRELTLS